jgi:hypothetical protein
MLSNLSYSIQTAPSRILRGVSKLTGSTLTNADYNKFNDLGNLVMDNYNIHGYDTRDPEYRNKLANDLKLLNDTKELYNKRFQYLDYKIKTDPRNEGAQTKMMNLNEQMRKLDFYISAIEGNLRNSELFPESYEESEESYYEGGKRKSTRRRKNKKRKTIKKKYIKRKSRK